MNELSKSDWAALYQAASEFKRASPWEWMDNEDLFAVENPSNGEVGYCSILGSGREEFGLGIFLGEEGYDRYTKLMAEEVEPEDFEESVMARLISMLFVDRDVLQKRDRDVIRSLGLQFRGRSSWPFFRSQRPGYVPWFLEKEEVIFLTTAIHQALVIAQRVQNSELDLLERETENLVLTLCHRGGKWLEEWRRPNMPNSNSESPMETIDPVTEAQLHLLRSRAGELGGTWEFDISMLPLPIGSSSDRPYFPSCFLAVEKKLGLIVGTNLTKPWLNLSEKRKAFIQILEKADELPREVRIKSDKVKRIVEPITSILGINLRVASLPMLEEAKASLYDHLCKRNT